MLNVFTSSRINQQETEKGIYFKLIELGIRQTKTPLKRIHCYNKIAHAMIAQKSSEVDTGLQKIGTDMIAMLREAKGERQLEKQKIG